MRSLHFNKGFKFAKQMRFLLLAGFFLSACEAQVKPMSFYKANGDERRSVLADCADNPSKQQEDGNCVNAAAALKGLQLALQRQRIYKINEEQAAASAAAGPIPSLVEACGDLDADTFKRCQDALDARKRRLLAELNAINRRITSEYEAKLEAL